MAVAMMLVLFVPVLFYCNYEVAGLVNCCLLVNFRLVTGLVNCCFIHGRLVVYWYISD